VIFLDASAMVAMLTGEPDANDLANRLAADLQRFTSPIAVFETVAAIMRKRQIDAVAARHVVERFLTIAGVTMSPVGRSECEAGLQAFDRFGKAATPRL
jgi:ribonuclease VapC